ncbi:hypothetical protein ACIRBX_04870 [Kitasatospora sp. NPDC096147]|uniref:hypothetical protein n=1 Tax=Kitasatospora sp. NPDC096147 TaxID=3364093 RepID=UPI00380D14A1
MTSAAHRPVTLLPATAPPLALPVRPAPRRPADLRLSQAVHAELAPAVPGLRRSFVELWRPDAELADRYRRYLRAQHLLAAASAPLQERAAERCAEAGVGAGAREAWAPGLAAYYLRRAERERDRAGHLLADLAAAGGPALLPVVPPLVPPAVPELIMTQYRLIEQGHPVALLGALLVLADSAPALGLAGYLARLTGLPTAGFHTLREHADLAGDHLAELERELDAPPLTDRQRAEVTDGALRAAGLLARLFRDLAGGGRAQR